MIPPHPRFQIVRDLRINAIRAERVGGLVTVATDVEVGKSRSILRVAPETARAIADEFERRWTS